MSEVALVRDPISLPARGSSLFLYQRKLRWVNFPLRRRIKKRGLKMKKSVTSLMDEIRKNLELLESSLPKRVDGWALSQMSKLPFKVLGYREALALENGGIGPRCVRGVRGG